MRIIAVSGPLGVQLDTFVTPLILTLSEKSQKRIVHISEKAYGVNFLKTVFSEEKPDRLKPNHSSLISAINESTADIVIVSGHFLFTDEDLRKLLNIKIFLECDQDTCLAQIINEQGEAQLDQTLTRYIKFVKPENDENINPAQKYADLVILKSVQTDTAVQANYKRIHDLLGSHAEHLPFFAKKTELNVGASATAVPKSPTS